MWKILYSYERQATPISKPSSPKPIGRGHQGPRRGASPIRLRRSKRRAAVTEVVNVNETIPMPVGETEPAENAEDTEKSVNASRATYTLA